MVDGQLAMETAMTQEMQECGPSARRDMFPKLFPAKLSIPIG